MATTPRPKYSNPHVFVPGRPYDFQAGYPVERDIYNILNNLDETKLSVGQGLISAVKTVSANYTVSSNDHTILVDATAGPLTITLPLFTIGTSFNVRKIDSSVNTVTVQPISATIDDDTNLTIEYQHSAVTLIFSGSDWSIF